MGFLSEWRPFSPSTAMARPLFEELMRDAWTPLVEGAGMRFTPRVNVTEQADAYEIECELPGIRPEDVQITLTGDTLTIQGEKRREDRREGDTCHVTEMSYGAFQRSFSFPAPVEADSVEATADHGMLVIRVGKSKATQPRRIEVRPGKESKKPLQTSAKEIPVKGEERRKG